MTPRPSPLWLVAGFGLWAGIFLLLYGVLSLGCAFGWHHVEAPWGTSSLRLGLLALLILSLAAHLALWLHLRRRTREAGHRSFVLRVSAAAALAALAASVFTFFGTATLSLCV